MTAVWPPGSACAIVSNAVATGSLAWEAKREADRWRYEQVSAQLNIVADAARLPRNGFFVYDHNGDDHLSCPLKTFPQQLEVSVYVHGDIYMPSVWSRFHEHFMGTLKAQGDAWVVNDWATRYPDLPSAVAALVSTPEAGQALASARAQFERDAISVRASLVWRQRWTRISLRTMLTCMVAAVLAVAFWSATAVAILVLSALAFGVAVVALLFAQSGIDYRDPWVGDLLRQQEAAVMAQGPDIMAARVAEAKRFLGARRRVYRSEGAPA